MSILIRPIYTIYAGVNGAGKSSLYNKETINDKEYAASLGIRVNNDELNSMYGDIKKAGYESVKLINTCLENRLTFHQETTLSGRSIINNIKRAKNAGYKIRLIYIGVDSDEIAIERVKFRKEHGGHYIEEELIKKRYINSLKALEEIFPLCDEINLYDNSSSIKNSHILIYRKTSIKEKGFFVCDKKPKWINMLLDILK